MHKSLPSCALALLLLSHASASQVKGEDLQNCRWMPGGQPIEQRVCDLLRRKDAEERAEREELERRSRELRAEDERRAAERAERQRQDDERLAAERAKEAEERAAQDRAWKEERARREEEEAQWTAQRQKECGADFGRPAVGMTLARAKRCVGDFELYSQVNRANGVVSMYRSPSLRISVMNGRIVHWARF